MIFKELIRRLFFHPTGIAIGKDTVILRPFWPHNRKKITIGKNCFIGRFCVLNPFSKYGDTTHHGRIVIGDGVYIGGFTQLHSMYTLYIEDNAVLSEHVYISDTSHGLNPDQGPIMLQPLESKGPVTIRKSAFVGYGAAVLPGVTIGEHSIVGARSTVTKDVPPYTMVIGTPAKIIKRFDRTIGQWTQV